MNQKGNRKLKEKRLFSYLIGSFIIFFIGSCQNARKNKPQAEEVVTTQTDTADIEKTEFGIPVDSFDIQKATIKKGQFLSGILAPYHITAGQLADLALKAKDIFDIRKLQVGKPYTVFYSKDTLKKARYFVYQPNLIDYVVYDLGDSVKVYQDHFPSETVEKEESGIIQSSLSEALSQTTAGMELAVNLARIYAWDIDFYRIRKGDYFKVIYDMEYIKGKPVALGKIKMAVFNHQGDNYYAFFFKDDSTGVADYFNEDAKSLRKAFLKAPLKYYRITSRYSKRRFHPVQHRYKAHLGTDYAAPTGTPIMATAAGTVIASAFTRFNGNYVKIRHNGTFTTQYLHMSRRAVKVGQHVQQGQTIGYVGSTGLATGPHVCYRFWVNGVQVNPYSVKFPPADPINKNDLAAFQEMVKTGMVALKNIPVDSSLSI